MQHQACLLRHGQLAHDHSAAIPYLLAAEESDDGDQVAGDPHDDEDDAAEGREVQQDSRVVFEQLLSGICNHSSVDSRRSKTVAVIRC